MDEISNLSVMFIEPSTNVRTTLHSIFTECGITRITHVLKASTAIPMLQKDHYDIILCEFDLSEGQNGQQLLEDLRRHRVLPMTSLFLMVTGERSQSKVISTIELAPTDYLLKPFTAASLLGRVNRALGKRTAFMPTYRAMEAGDLDAAVLCCQQGEITSPRHAVDFRFLRAELYLRQGQLKQAEYLYDELSLTPAMEWARLGLAKTWFMQNRLDDAENALGALLRENGKLWEAYDCLADVMESRGRLPEAQKMLMDAVALSPHTVHRLRRLGRMALANGDMDTALTSFQSVATKVKHSQFRDPEDTVHLVQALLGKDNPGQASAVVRDLDKSPANFRKTEACSAISSALILQHKEEPDNAALRLSAAVDACKEHDTGLSNEVKLVLAQCCLNNDMRDEAERIMLEVMNNITDDATMTRVQALLERGGHKELSESMAQQSREQGADLTAACEAKLGQGDYQGAVDLMSEAAQRMPENAEVALNAAIAVLARIGHEGWDDDLGAQAHGHVDNLRRLNPAHPRLQEVSNQYRATLKKYNIPFERMSGKLRMRA